jgi:hypothetical protein
MPQRQEVSSDIKAILEEAYRIVLPYLEPNDGSNGIPMIRYVYMCLHRTFPTLSEQQIASLVTELRRIHIERNKSTLR